MHRLHDELTERFEFSLVVSCLKSGMQAMHSKATGASETTASHMPK